MDKVKENYYIQIFVLVTYLGMITVNALANILPINGIDTGAISDAYPNLFAPIGFTFSVWGAIYLLLALYTLYQLGFFKHDYSKEKWELIDRIGIYFIISSIANAAWIFSWHYMLIPLSMILMLVILGCLVQINRITRFQEFTIREKAFIRAPFSVYFGWISIASIANFVVLTVSLNWNWFNIDQSLYTSVLIGVGVLIGSIITFINKDILYALTLIWAFFGIYSKHTSVQYFNGQYSIVIMAAVLAIILLVVEVGFLFSKNIRKTEN